MTTKHTPGPWKKAERLNGPWWHISAESSGLGPGQGRQAVACVHGGSKRGAKAYAEMFEANARLIAAAPDLLEALQVMVRDYAAAHASIGDLEMSSALLQAQWAIARATGESK